jgi:ssDNA-binding Zn-finger/Zn-ribbon topoisomerase 1
VKRLSGAFAKVVDGIRRSTTRVRVIKDCPKCQLPMWVVTGARWCSRCGHREMCDDTPLPGATAAAGAAAKGVEWKSALRVVPRWAWVLMGGLLAVVLGSLDAGLLLPPDCFARAAWTTAQVVTGLVGMVLAQVSVCSLLGAHKEGVSLWDLVVPERVWRLALKRLPQTQGQVCAAAWSLALVVCGLIFINGLTYFLPKKGEVKPQVYVAKILDIKKEQLQEEEAPKPQATAPPQPQPTTPLPQPTTGGTAPRETARCVVVGYTVENDEVTSLVVARQEGDELRYVGTVRPTLTPEEKDDLLKRFGRLASSRPVFRNFERPVVWLKPKLNCEVEHTGTGEDALLKEARFKGLVEDDKPAPDGAAATNGQRPAKAAPKAPATKAPATSRTAKPRSSRAATGRP